MSYRRHYHHHHHHHQLTVPSLFWDCCS